MKKLTALLLKVSLLLSGVMIVTNQVNATKRDVQSAMALIDQARAAIGGDNALSQVQNLSMRGTSTRTFQLEGQAERQISGEFEIAMMPPDGLFRIETLGANHDGAKMATPRDETSTNERIIRIESANKVAVAGGGEAVAETRERHNDELTRYMIALLLTAPARANVSYDYVGDGEVDGVKADVIAVTSQSGNVMRLYLDKSSHLPLMMTHQGVDMPSVIALRGPAGAGDGEHRVMIRKVPGEPVEGEADVIIERRGDLPPAGANGQVMIFKHEGQPGPGQTAAGEPGVFRMKMAAPKEAEIQTRFADYRMVNGVMLPHRLTQTVNGKQTEVLIVAGYEINSPATAEKFTNGNVRFVRKARD